MAVGRLAEDDDAVKAATPKEAPKSKGKGRGKEKDKTRTRIAATSRRRSLIGLVLAPLTDELREKTASARTSRA